MNPNFHVPPELLLEYASAQTDEATSLITACHLTLCPTCRADTARWEAGAGGLLETIEEASLAEGAVEALLAKLDTIPASEPQPPKTSAFWPSPLLDYLPGDSVDKLPWKTILPGAEMLELPLTHNGLPVRVTRTRPGFFIPKHTHQDRELTLVLAGGFTDSEGHFERGDLKLADPSITHQQRFDKGEACISLVVNGGRLLPKGVIANLVGLFVDLADEHEHVVALRPSALKFFSKM